MKLLLLLLILGSDYGKKPTQHAEQVEINTCYDGGKVCYTQILFWRWSHDYMRYDIASWALIERARIIPHAQGYAVVVEGERAIIPTIIHSHTHVGVDPERLNRHLLDDKHRVPLFPRKIVPK